MGIPKLEFTKTLNLQCLARLLRQIHLGYDPRHGNRNSAANVAFGAIMTYHSGVSALQTCGRECSISVLPIPSSEIPCERG
jgi:hypothetical protein